MTALASDSSFVPHTSAMGSMIEDGSAASELMEVLVVFGSPPPSTGSTPSRLVFLSPSTTTGPSTRIVPLPTESTAAAILEIRRRSGLTWEELGDLFDVSRRSIHHWASGKPVSSNHEWAIRRVLTAFRHLDSGERAATRALILRRDAEGMSALDLLKEGSIEEAIARATGERPTSFRRRPLSEEATARRRPPEPGLLVGALQDRPERQPKARIGRAVRTPRKNG